LPLVKFIVAVFGIQESRFAQIERLTWVRFANLISMVFIESYNFTSAPAASLSSSAASDIFSLDMSRPARPELKRPPRLLVVSDQRVSAADLKRRLAERVQRQQADTRSDAQRWLGEPEPGRSALAQHTKR
jgi:hypothetical protein